MGQYPWGRRSLGQEVLGQDIMGQNFVGQNVVGAISLGQEVSGAGGFGFLILGYFLICVQFSRLGLVRLVSKNVNDTNSLGKFLGCL